jgi:putative ABC transport system permease protein
MSIRRVIARLFAISGARTRLDRELEGEVRAHLELAEADGLSRGLSKEEARREARRKFGGIEQMKEIHRDRRGIRWLETLTRDFRYGLASLKRAPGFTTVVVAVLGLGIGGTVAMFSVVDAVFLQALPFPEAGRIVRIWEAPRPGSVNATTAPQFVAWKRLGADFTAMSAERPVSAALNDPAGPTRLGGKEVTAAYFQVFRIAAQIGRTFTATEDQPGAAPAIVLSNATWQTYFGSDPHILERRVTLDGVSYQVAGVLPPGVFDRDQTEFWKPLVFTPAQLSSQTHWLTVYGRLRAGVTIAQARERMQAIYAATLDTAPLEERKGTIAIAPLAQLLLGSSLERSILVAFGAVLLVLLIACANVANLLFAQGATRRTELAVRAALGAGRGRLVAQLLTENLALCILGGAAGVGCAYLLLHLGAPLLAQSLPFTADVALHLRVLGFAAAIVLAVALLAGMLPALEASFGNLADSLKRSERGFSARHIRTRRAVVIGEVALSLVLVAGALLLTKSLLKLQQLNTGVRIDNVITMSLDLPVSAYSIQRKATYFYDAVAERIRAIPGVANVGTATQLPLRWISNGEGMLPGGMEKLVRVRCKRVDPGYFRTLDIPVLAGRGITDQDREGAARIIVINQTLAARLAQAAGMKDPVGKRVRLSSVDYAAQTPTMLDVEIAGIIRSERTAAPGDPDPAVVYVPLAQSPSFHINLLVRTQQEKAAILPAVRNAVREIDPNVALADVATMRQVRDRTLSGASRPAWLIGAFAVLAVLLAAIGLYGVASYSATQQRRELGIRIALGARREDVLAFVLRGALAMTSAGLVFGLFGVLALTRVIRSLLFEVSPLDPLALAAACAVMLVIGVGAGFLPAHRASRIDPIVTLRDAG